MISWRSIAFFVFFMAVWGGGHVYLARRLIVPLSQYRRAWRMLAWALLGLSFAVVPAVFFGRLSGLNPGLLDQLAWVAYLDMGLFLILVPLLVVSDLAGVVGGLGIRLRRLIGPGPNPEPATDPDRRNFLRNGFNFGVVALSGSMTAAGYQEAMRLARVKEVEIPIPNLPAGLEGFRLVQLSDIHIGPTIKGDYFRGIVERTNQLQADLVAVTGDLVDGHVPVMREHIAPLDDIRSRHGTFFVTGNHEYYWDAEAWCDEVARHRTTVLNNSHRLIEHGGGRLLLAGATDYSAHHHVARHASDPAAARSGAPQADVSILLAHQPKSAFDGAGAGYDLQLSGHIHGGQFFPWNLVIGLVEPFGTGLHRLDRMWLYVSAGTGYWGPPVRLGVPSEITLVTLVPA